MNKVLVTGAGGFLGFEIAKRLKAQGYDVYNFSRSHHKKLDQIQISTIKGDLQKLEDVKKLFEHKFDIVFHVAALAGIWGKKEDFININFIGTQNLVNEAKNAGVKKFIYTSSPSVVYSDRELINADESTTYPDYFLNDYGYSKRLAEEYVLNSKSNEFLVCALRPHLIWGPGDPHILPRLIERRKSNKLRIVGDGTNLVDIIHVYNAAQAHIDACNALNLKMNGQAYFIGQERPVVLWDFINQMLTHSKIDQVSKKIPFKVAYSLGSLFEFIFKLFRIESKEPPMTRFVALQLATSHYFSHEKAKRDFNYQIQLSIEDGLKTL